MASGFGRSWRPPITQAHGEIGSEELGMRVLAIERAISGVKQELFTPKIAEAEARRVWELYQQGILREIYFRADEDSAVLVLECPELEVAMETLAGLPMVKAGLIGFELIPLKAYPGFARLFAQPS
jgi:muconolactone delta-isomerase